MAKFKVHKDKNFTTIGNHCFKNKELSFKAKGLLSTMLSLPDNWDYSISGLVGLATDEKASVSKGLKELEQQRYLKRKPIRDKGRIVDWDYDIYEKPLTDFQEVEKQEVEFLEVENHPQLNTNILNTNISKYIKEKYKEKNEVNKYGKYKRILLTKEQLNKLYEDYNQEQTDNQISLLDEYVQSNNNKNKYTDFNLVLRKSIRENWFKGKHENKETEPNWFNQEIKEDKLSEEEQHEIDEILSVFK